MIQATNNFVFILRDDIKKEESGLLIPGQSREKPHQGTVVSVGNLVGDANIKKSKGKKCVFHKGNGFEIEVEGTTYLVLEGERIIGLL